SDAFMRTEADARELALTKAAIGRDAGRDVTAVLSSMSESLGRAVGNAIEVVEARDCLRGGGPADLRELCVVLASQVLARTGLPAACADVARALDVGSAFERIERWVAVLVGDVAALASLTLSPDQELVRAPRSGV